MTTWRIAMLFCLCAGLSHAAETSNVGPFTLEMRDKRISSGRFPSTSGNPFEKISVSEFRVLRGGKPVDTGSASFEGAASDESGQVTAESFWDARVLSGAPRPAVLVAITAFWLITDEGDTTSVRTLVPASTDLASWQWLDADHGQPGLENNVTIHDSRKEPRSIADGTLLMLNHRGVLDVKTLAFYPFQINSAERVQQLDGYNAGDSPIVQVSPERSQLVYVGTRYVDGLYQYALVVANYRSRTFYALPFDSNATRFESAWDANPTWIDHWFEWRHPDGERLVPRDHVTPPPWLGRLMEFVGDRNEYRLYPVDAGMLPVLAAFIESEFGATSVPHSTMGPSDTRSRDYDLDGKPLTLWYNADDRALALFPGKVKGFEPEGSQALVRSIGERFNAMLAGGLHQAHFTSFKDHR